MRARFFASKMNEEMNKCNEHDGDLILFYVYKCFVRQKICFK